MIQPVFAAAETRAAGRTPAADRTICDLGENPVQYRDRMAYITTQLRMARGGRTRFTAADAGMEMRA
jgi:hypothetical protein